MGVPLNHHFFFFTVIHFGDLQFLEASICLHLDLFYTEFSDAQRQRYIHLIVQSINLVFAQSL